MAFECLHTNIHSMLIGASWCVRSRGRNEATRLRALEIGPVCGCWRAVAIKQLARRAARAQLWCAHPYERTRHYWWVGSGGHNEVTRPLRKALRAWGPPGGALPKGPRKPHGGPNGSPEAPREGGAHQGPRSPGSHPGFFGAQWVPVCAIMPVIPVGYSSPVSKR